MFSFSLVCAVEKFSDGSRDRALSDQNLQDVRTRFGRKARVAAGCKGTAQSLFTALMSAEQLCLHPSAALVSQRRNTKEQRHIKFCFCVQKHKQIYLLFPDVEMFEIRMTISYYHSRLFLNSFKID